MEPIVNCTRIDLPFLSTTKRTVNSVKECYLLLFDTYIQHKIVVEYIDLDTETGIPETVLANYRWTRLKKDLCDVDMYRSRVENLYGVSMNFNGVSDGTGFLFETPEKALAFYNQLVQYFIS